MNIVSRLAAGFPEIKDPQGQIRVLRQPSEPGTVILDGVRKNDGDARIQKIGLYDLSAGSSKFAIRERKPDADNTGLKEGTKPSGHDLLDLEAPGSEENHENAHR